jgi:hypothetical protein
MRTFTWCFALAGLLAAPGFGRGLARAADTITVELRDGATVGTVLVTVGDIATISGGDSLARSRIAGLDLLEIKAREPGATIGRRGLEYRLLLAGVDARVIGPERVTVTAARRPVTVEEVSGAARAELLRYLGTATDPGTIDLAAPIAVRLPDVPASERIAITGKPRGTPGASGRVQMDMSLAAGGEILLTFPVYFDVHPAAGSTSLGTVNQAGGRAPANVAWDPRNAGEAVVQPGQRVRIVLTNGAIRVVSLGDAQQAGRVGQTIRVQNVDTRKTLSALVTGPGTVELDIGGGQ